MVCGWIEWDGFWWRMRAVAWREVVVVDCFVVDCVVVGLVDDFFDGLVAPCVVGAGFVCEAGR